MPEKKYLMNRGVVTETQSNMGMRTSCIRMYVHGVGVLLFYV